MYQCIRNLRGAAVYSMLHFCTCNAEAPKNDTSVSDYMGSQNRVGRSEFIIFFAYLFLVDSSPYGRIFLLYVNIAFADFILFFQKNSIKKIGLLFQIRVGRDTGNRSIFFLA